MTECARCQGLMVWDEMREVVLGGLVSCAIWRCVNCGHVVFPGQRRDQNGARVVLTSE